jgi:lysozyme family protein
MTFEQAVQIVLMHEGGEVNHPSDPGGHTKYGISKRAFPKEDISSLTLDRAKELYKKHYWDLCECDKLPLFIRLMVFDCAVNQGVTRATTFLQRIGKVKVDGLIGPVTLRSLEGIEPFDLVYLYEDMRLKAYHSNPNWGTFGKGWGLRLQHISYLSYLSAHSAGALH